MTPHTPWRIQILIYLLGFGCFYQQSVLLPVLPLFAGELDLSISMIGFVLAARFLVPALFAAQIGEWTARFGLKRSLATSSVAMVLCTPLYLFANNLPMLLLAQVLSGTFYMFSWIAAQTFATRVPDRAWVLGIFATVTALGMTVGPIVGGLALDMGGFGSAFAAYGIGAILLTVTALLLGRHPAGAPTEPAPRVRGQLMALLGRPSLQAAFLFSFICLFLIGLRGNFLPIFLEDNALNASAIGLVLAAGSLGQAVVRPFTSQIMRRGGLMFAMTTAAVIGITGLSLMPLSTELVVLMVLAFVHGCGAGLHQSLGLILLADNTSASERGYAVGLRATINQLSTAGAPLLAGAIAAFTGVPGAFYVIGALLLMATFWLYRVLRHAHRVRVAANTIGGTP